jgi:hypothetical protein
MSDESIELGIQRGDNIQVPSMDDIEARVVAAGLTAPRITPQHVDDQIVGAQYHVFAGTTVTVCCLTLRNGFNVTGESACASPENFNEELGREIARRNARDKIWSLEGYALKNQLTAVQLIKHIHQREKR